MMNALHGRILVNGKCELDNTISFLAKSITQKLHDILWSPSLMISKQLLDIQNQIKHICVEKLLFLLVVMIVFQLKMCFRVSN
jgi:hypothetical protein